MSYLYDSGGRKMAAKSIRILLVEDNQPDADFIRAALAEQTRTTFDVKHVARLEQGLQWAKHEESDIVLLDLDLPDSKGLDTLVRMVSSGLPIVVLTGLDDEHQGEAALDIGAQDYLVKGQVTSDLLVRAVRYAIQRHKQQAQQREAKLALDAKNLVLDELHELNEMKSRFVEVVTHEMRTPMTAVLCAVDLLIDGSLGEVSPDQKKYLELVARNIDRLARFSTEVLRLSRLDADRYELRPSETDLRDTLTPVVDLLAQSSTKKGITLTLQGAEDDSGVKVFADPDAVSQVVTNLVSNALQHCPRGTRVDISWRQRDDGLVEVTVSDDGRGIDAGLLDKVFDRFYQADYKTGIGYKGTGIGLSVCHGLVEKMGGSIVAESPDSRGSTFRFTLPGVEPGDEILFGKLAVKMGYISLEQLQRVVGQQHDGSAQHQRLGELLMQQKVLSKLKLEHILGYQDALLSRPHPRRPAAVGESLLGRLAVARGHLTQKELNRCVWIQELRRADGVESRLGQVMVEQEYLTEDDIISLLGMQHQQIAICPPCGARYNTSRPDEHQSFACPRCGTYLQVPSQTSGIDVCGDVH